ncbi:MAG: SpoIID/LytB domain-containing protein [Chloroflexi bacterium]|nr:SpoIID/LytB domain-containing protein [Chloroflexota bacterium]
MRTDRGWLSVALLLSVLVLFGLFVLSCVWSVSAEPLPATGFAGQVRSLLDGSPVAGARVSLGSNFVTATDGEGRYRLLAPPGWYEVAVERPGYIAMSEAHQPAASRQVTTVDFALVPMKLDAAGAKRIEERLRRREGGVEIVPLKDEPAPIGPAVSRPLQREVAGGRSTLYLPLVQRGSRESCGGAPAAGPGAQHVIRVWLRQLDCVVTMDIEEYLRGVVPSEMPASWHPEALKAQAIASRSYAATSRRFPERGADVDDSELTQVYRNTRYATTDVAVAATRGQVAQVNGRIIQALFFADSGGATENNENVWGGSPVPYLRSVPDPDAVGVTTIGPWEIRMRAEELARLLSVSFVPSEATIASKYPSGRLRSLQVKAADGRAAEVTLLADRWRAGIVGQRPDGRTGGALSSLITEVRRNPDGTFSFVGVGFGHGLGLPQYGALGQALRGRTSQQIIGHYFTGAAVVPW